MSNAEVRRARAISSIERLPSAFVATFHSSGVSVTGPFAPSRATRTGTESVPGIFFERIFHSSRRLEEEIRVRAADRAGFALDTRRELERALAPERERVDRVLALDLAELGVRDLPV